jgi:hypothetical protein
VAGRRSNFVRYWTLLTCTGFAVFFVGLVMTLHESRAHESCDVVVLIVNGQNVAPHPPSGCGFVDTVYWVGTLLLATAGCFSFGCLVVGLYAWLQWQLTDGVLPAKVSRARNTLVSMTSAKRRHGVFLEGSAGAASTLRSGPPFGSVTHSTPTLVLEKREPEPVPVVSAPPAAAWYPDPTNPERIRWWDGRTWGESRLRP